MHPEQPGRVHRLPATVLTGAVLLAVTAHVLASLGDHGPMAWLMVLMGVTCLSCLVHARRGWDGPCLARAAGHFMVMSVAMLAVHAAVLVLTGGSHGGHTHGGVVHAAVAGGADQHTVAMLEVMGVELLCLVLGTVVLRLARRSAHTAGLTRRAPC